MFIIQSFNVKILSCVLFDIIVHFIIQKLKNRQHFLKTVKAKFCQQENLRILSFLSLYTFLECVFIFQFLNDKMHNYVKQSISSLAGKFLSFLSLYTFWGTCVYFSIFEWQNTQLCCVWHNCAFYHSKIEK